MRKPAAGGRAGNNPTRPGGQVNRDRLFATHDNGRSTAPEVVYIERKGGGPRRMLRILGRRQKGRFTVLELAPQRRRCHMGGCLRLVDVPASYCRDHERGDA